MKILLIPALIIMALTASAQKKSAKQIPAGKDTTRVSLRMKAQYYGDSIVVRWAPGNAVSWLTTQKNGFILKRRVFRKGEKNKFTLVDSSTMAIAPWKLDAWGNYFKSSHDSLSAIAAQVAYGKILAFDNGKQGNSFAGISEKYNEQQNRFGFAMMIADFDPAAAEGLGLRFVERNPSKGLYYLYAIVPADNKRTMRIDTGRVLVDGSQSYIRETFTAINGIAADKNIKLLWSSGAPVRAYSGYVVERSEDGKNFTRLNKLPFVSFKTGKESNKPIEFGDSVNQNYKNYYYRVSGLNSFGDVSLPSPVLKIQAVDLTAPHYPIITSIKNIQGTGSIHLEWLKKEKEPDFKGYVIGRSTNLKGPFEPISKDFLPYGTTSFTDDHPLTSAPNYYIVAAVDTSGNAGRSMPAYMNVDDHTPPAQPAGLAGKIDSNGRVSIHWNWGHEDDLAGYKIFFANAPNHQFTPLCKDLLTDSLFKDSIVLQTLTKKIYYKVIAYDRAMNASPASAVLVLDKPDKVPPVAAMIHDFKVTDSSVIIKWYRSPSADAAKQLIYRKEAPSGDWVLLATLPVKDTLYKDNKVISLQNYDYAIETIDSSGLQSGKSFPLRVHVYTMGNEKGMVSLQVQQVAGRDSVLLKWTAPAGEISYYILFKSSDNSGLRMSGNIPGNLLVYEDRVVAGNYQYALKAVFKNGAESAVSEIKKIQVSQ